MWADASLTSNPTATVESFGCFGQVHVVAAAPTVQPTATVENFGCFGCLFSFRFNVNRSHSKHTLLTTLKRLTHKIAKPLCDMNSGKLVPALAGRSQPCTRFAMGLFKLLNSIFGFQLFRSSSLALSRTDARIAQVALSAKSACSPGCSLLDIFHRYCAVTNSHPSAVSPTHVIGETLAVIRRSSGGQPASKKQANRETEKSDCWCVFAG
jgi:hypothetical protein